MLQSMLGAVRIVVTGSNVTRFLNLCTAHQIQLYHLRYVDVCTLHASLSVGDFKRLRWYMGRTGCKVHILQRFGLRFWVHKLRGRTLLWVGGVLMMALFFVLNNFLWVIDIRAEAGIPVDALRQQLERMGVHAGTWIGDLDEERMRLSLLQQFDELAVLSVARFGNSLTIEAYYREPTPPLLDDDAITGMAALCDGFITSQTVTGGTALFAVGDAVHKGELLITAVMTPTQESASYFYGHGMGEIYATTWHEQTAVQPATRQQKTYTGQSTTQYALVIGNFRLNLYIGSGIPIATCDKIVTKERLSIGRTLQLPISLVTQTYHYYVTTTVTYTAEQALQPLAEAATARLMETVDGTLLASDPTLSVVDDGLWLTQKITCSQQIAVEVVDDSPLPQQEGMDSTT